MHLLRSQKRDIAQLLLQKGFQPADFRWESQGADERLVYKSTRYRFLFGTDQIVFCPARRDIEVTIRLTGAPLGFPVYSRWISEWLECLRQELATPDWEELSSGRAKD